MTERLPNRRQSMLELTTLSLLGLGGPMPRGADAAVGGDGLDDFTTFMKLYSDLAPGRHWLWFTGRWDLIVPGQPPVPLVGFDTLARRDVTREGDDIYATRGWEGMVFWDLTSGELVDRMLHPIGGREIFPHFTKEGPTQTRTSPAGFHIGAGAEPASTRPLKFKRVVVGDDVWLERGMVARAPHPLKPSEWKLESSGETYWTNLTTVLHGKVSDIRDPKVTMASSDYTIAGQTVPLPWMMMGQIGAMVGWVGYGRKFASLANLPRDRRQWYDVRHPELFGAAEPWTAYTNAFIGYRAVNKPATS